MDGTQPVSVPWSVHSLGDKSLLMLVWTGSVVGTITPSEWKSATHPFRVKEVTNRQTVNSLAGVGAFEATKFVI